MVLGNSKMDFWQDPTFQFIILAAIAIITIIITVVLYWKQRQKKKLSFALLSTPLLSVKNEIKKKVQILYDGKPVDQVHLAVVKIINPGNTLIEKKDYETPIILDFGKDSEILSGSMTEAEPKGLKPTWRTQGSAMTIEPLLLNSGDNFTFNLLVKGYEDMSITGRIAGVKEITPFKKSNRKYYAYTLIGMSVEISGVLLALGDIHALVTLPIAFFGTALAIYGILKWK
jgi:hypothetical protein